MPCVTRPTTSTCWPTVTAVRSTTTWDVWIHPWLVCQRKPRSWDGKKEWAPSQMYCDKVEVHCICIQYNMYCSSLELISRKKYFLVVLVRILITVDSLLFVGANVCGLIVITLLVPWYNFVGNQFVVLQCKTYHYFVKRLWGQKFVGKSNPGNLQTLIFHKQWWFDGKNFFHHTLNYTCLYCANFHVKNGGT